MKFSIVVPVYNAQKYIQECCDSVFQQSYEDYELILVDDGSSDRSGVLCDLFAEKHLGKCITVHTENQGPLLARQTGIREATGDVLVFLDSDDCIRGDALEILAKCFQRADCDIVCYNASDKGDYASKFRSFPLQHNFVIEGEGKSSVYKMMAHAEIVNALWLKAAKKHCFDHFPDFADLSYVKNGEDLLMSLYMFTAARRIVYLDENLYFYRQREGSIVHSFNPNRAHSIKTVHREMERFIDLWGMPELHSAHYAREVHGWIETVLILLDNKSCLEPDEFRQLFRGMATDPYFLHAYASMDANALSGTYRILAKCLHDKCYLLLQIAAYLKKTKSRMKGNKLGFSWQIHGQVEQKRIS